MKGYGWAEVWWRRQDRGMDEADTEGWRERELSTWHSTIRDLVQQNQQYP